MSRFWHGAFVGPQVGILWAFIVATTVSVLLSFTTGAAFRPGLVGAVLAGVPLGLAAVRQPGGPPF